ncbi:MAG: dipeptide epimerase [Ignavibacteriales bacterium]|nr:L-Ala-D/L-Glu epimerase [Ignavibacteriaceae bacterium]MBW7871956.1 dipeptide epimerase [Ignavibacteria bacterium]MCZ2144386.1 dipeptide epimerase [Ignavibacteriales bacterium]OQY75123.1 MAG: dipeptide epimerase [Ignavibacteriales bacterium UTCHB3]WKZ72950.1 MAG: dipeptide epimerase [Ignavibacteriaceae bacterium]
MNSRRDFIKKASLLAGVAVVPGSAKNITNFAINSMKNDKLKLSFKPYTLELKHVFTLATSSRTTTPVMLTEIRYGDLIGYGEASMPPYLGESHETVAAFLSKVNLEQFSDPFKMEEILDYVDGVMPGNPAAKASVDIALHDLVGKIIGQPWYKIWGYDATKTPYTSFTIGIDTPEVVRQKVKEAEEYKILKVKLGRDTDKEMIETIRSVTDKPLCVDVNQGWKDKQFALDMAHWLHERGVEFLEQPMSKTDYDSHAWLTERSPIPIIGDEAVQGPKDVAKAKGAYSGINIKLMKCGGMRNANKMIALAQAFDMKLMIGCMTETSCAISAAAHLSPMMNWADLDGALLISNDVFRGTTVEDGKVTIAQLPGIGVEKL